MTGMNAPAINPNMARGGMGGGMGMMGNPMAGMMGMGGMGGMNGMAAGMGMGGKSLLSNLEQMLIMLGYGGQGMNGGRVSIHDTLDLSAC
jgi:hypothetical protein